MKILRKTLFLFLIMLPVAGTALAEDNFWFGAKAGTLGIGLEATSRPLPWFDFRAGANRYDYNDTGTQAGIGYDAELSLDTLYATANFRFPLSPMRRTAGAFINNNKLRMTSQDSPSFDVGGVNYTSADVGTMESVTSFDKSAPYLGIGFDFELFNKLGLNLDFGVLWQGSPGVTLTSTGLLANDPAFMASLESERLELEAEMEDFKAWPVLSVGFNFSFF